MPNLLSLNRATSYLGTALTVVASARTSFSPHLPRRYLQVSIQLCLPAQQHLGLLTRAALYNTAHCDLLTTGFHYYTQLYYDAIGGDSSASSGRPLDTIFTKPQLRISEEFPQHLSAHLRGYEKSEDRAKSPSDTVLDVSKLLYGLSAMTDKTLLPDKPRSKNRYKRSDRPRRPFIVDGFRRDGAALVA